MSRPGYWNKIEQGLRGISNLPSSVHSVLGNSDKLKFHQTVPSGVDSRAKAYVTTGDANDDGNIETINFVVTNLEKEWPQDILSKINQMDESDPVFQDILSGIAKTLIHELAHIDDHSDGSFPGGEGVAESRENSFTPNFRTASTTNVSNRVKSPLELSKNGGIKMKEELTKLANHLDKLGHSDLADRLDLILKSATAIPKALETLNRVVEDSLVNQNPDESKTVEEKNQEEGAVEPDPDDQTDANEAAKRRIESFSKLLSREFSFNGKSVRRN